MKITIVKELEDFWGTAEEFANMSDEEIIELCREYIVELLDNASWKVERLDRTGV